MAMAPGTGVPEPSAVTVPEIAPRDVDIVGSASVTVPLVTLTAVGGPQNPGVCPPAGSIMYR